MFTSSLATLLPTLGAVERMEAVRGPRDEVHLALGHTSGAASSVVLSLTAPAGISETVFWGNEGLARMTGEVDVTAAYVAAGSTPFDARFGLGGRPRPRRGRGETLARGRTPEAVSASKSDAAVQVTAA